jgi:hypothetical protein
MHSLFPLIIATSWLSYSSFITVTVLGNVHKTNFLVSSKLPVYDIPLESKFFPERFVFLFYVFPQGKRPRFTPIQNKLQNFYAHGIWKVRRGDNGSEDE